MSKRTIVTVVCVLAILLAWGAIRHRELRSEIPPALQSQTSTADTFTLGQGDHSYSLQVNGLTREYLVHVPANYDKNSATPLILAFHGGGGNMTQIRNSYDLIPKSDQAGFIIVFPNGDSRFPRGKLATWNAGNCCGYARDKNIDDVAFVKAMIDDVKSKFNIGKVFAIGMSNGGMMAYRLACDMPDTFTAIASVAGTNNYDECSPSHPVSVLHIHALDDDHVLFAGGAGPAALSENEEADFTSVQRTIADWTVRNKCDSTPQRVLENADAYCDLYTGCADNVQVKLCATTHGGHSWPGSQKAANNNKLETGDPASAISANDVIWDFFKEQQ